MRARGKEGGRLWMGGKEGERRKEEKSRVEGGELGGKGWNKNGRGGGGGGGIRIRGGKGTGGLLKNINFSLEN